MCTGVLLLVWFVGCFGSGETIFYPNFIMPTNAIRVVNWWIDIIRKK